MTTGYRVPIGLEVRSAVAERLPHILYVETTNRCNSLCPICPRTFDLRERDADLSYDQFVSILDQIPSATRLVLHGIGEPLMNRDLPRMVAEARRRGLHVLFNSNLVLLREPLAEALIQADLNELRVSLDAATPATYARIRGIDKLPQVKKMIRLMLAVRDRLGATSPHVSMWFVAMRENIDELPAFVELAAELGVGEVARPADDLPARRPPGRLPGRARAIAVSRREPAAGRGRRRRQGARRRARRDAVRRRRDRPGHDRPSRRHRGAPVVAAAIAPGRRPTSPRSGRSTRVASPRSPPATTRRSSWATSSPRRSRRSGTANATAASATNCSATGPTTPAPAAARTGACERGEGRGARDAGSGDVMPTAGGDRWLLAA